MRGWRSAALAGAVVLGLAAGTPPPAGATEGDGGRAPALSLDRSELRPGERVVVTLQDWPGRTATLSVCGNAAARGSVDCDMVGSLGVSLARTGTTTLTELVVGTPPGTCPCVVRAASPTHDQVATVPITLEGVPTGPVVGPASTAPLQVTVVAAPARRGWLDRARAALGGPTAYDVTVAVENRSGEPVRGLALAGSAARRGVDDVATLALDPPAELAPGETWEQVVQARLPAPVWGRVVWEVTASGAGPTTRAEAATQRTPVALVVLALLLVADVVVMVVRRVRRRRRRAVPDGPPGAEEDLRPPVTRVSPAVHGRSSSPA